MKSLCSKLDSALVFIGCLLQSPLLLAIRLFWGWQFFLSGKGKLMNLERTTSFFESLHLPMPKLNAIAAGSVECFGGLLLMAGLLTRFVSPALIFTMIVAYVTADNEALRGAFREPDKFTAAAPFLFLFASVIVFAFGPGKLSLDAMVFNKSGKT